MGHVRNYMLGEVAAHFRRRRGEQVLRPMGFDSFGLPAENAAIKEGGNPRDVTPRNMASIRAQMERLGWAIDWDRVLATHEPEYYRWTQWLFLRFFEHGLAYRKDVPVKWCPNDQTVLANEQVVDGHCERCGALVESKNLEQWLFRITTYADQLLDEMELLESWPERVLTMQRNWIGRSEGAEVVFRVDGLDLDIPVFTTRPDTLFGATFFVLAPEHPLIPELVAGTEHEQQVLDYARHAAARSTADREAKERDGVFTGRYVVNPVNGERIPVWVAAYVLVEYGTGAIMAVPAHDERDHEFAQRYELPIVEVVDEDERLVNSAQFSGLSGGGGESAPSSTGSPRAGAGGRPSATGCATGCSRASATGALRSRSSTARAAGSCRCRTTSSPCCCRRSTTTCRRAAHRSPRPRTGSGRRARRAAAGAPRDRHDGHVRRLVVVLPPLLRPEERQGAVRPRARRLLAADRPVHRRGRARDLAPALLALLRQGAERHRARRLPRAVRAAVHAGHALLPRRQDVQVEGQRDRARRVHRAPWRRCRRLYLPFLGPVDQDAEWQDCRSRRDSALPPPALARRTRRRRQSGRRDDGDVARAEGARDHRQGHGRHRPAVRAEHADRRGDGAGERRSRASRTTLRRASPSRRLCP